MDKKRLRAEYDLLSEKLHRLKMALIREYDHSVKFKLEKDIEDLAAERQRIEQQLDHAERWSVRCPYRGLAAFRTMETTRILHKKRILHGYCRMCAAERR